MNLGGLFSLGLSDDKVVEEGKLRQDNLKADMVILAEKDIEMEKFAEQHRQRTSQEMKAWRQGE